LKGDRKEKNRREGKERRKEGKVERGKGSKGNGPLVFHKVVAPLTTLSH